MTGIQSITGAGDGAGSISFANGGIKFNNKVAIDNNGKISGVANGIADNDAVNVSQLNKVSAAAKTEVVKGTNIASVVPSNATDDGHTVYTVNAKGTSVSVDGNFNLNTTTDAETNVTNYGISLKDSVTIGGTHAVTINGTDGTVTGLTNTTWNKDSITSGRAATEDQLQAVATEAGKHTTLSNGKNTTVNPVTTADGHLEYKVDVNDELKDIKSIIGAGEGAGSISFANDGIKFNNKVTIDNTGKISGVANGIADNDAVNVSQLNKVSAAAKTEVVKGTNIASVVPSNATDDGHTVYTVNAKGTSVSVDGNFNLNTTTDAETNVTNYGISLKDSVTIGGTHAVTINGTDGTVTGLTNTTWNKDSITSGRAATEDQLHAVATEAGKHTTLSNGKNTTVESTVKDGQTDYKVNVAGDLTDITSVANGDSKINLNKDSIIISNGNKYFAITNSGIGMSYIGADYSAKSIMLGENGTTISGGLNVAGSKITGVAAGTEDTDAVNVSQLKKVSDTANAGWNLSTNGVATGATNVKPGDYVDFSGDKNISVSHDGTKVQVKLNKNIDVNYVQTNALNAKYNLSVGTMAENGIMPFLVNSTGAFYAANNNFSVDKYGKVIATAGEIGNVVLQNGVYTGNSALRDGELYVGDASGNYSQITTTGAKLGQVTIAADGKISGVAAGAITETSTDAVNGSQLHAVKTELQTSDKHLVGNPASADGYYKPDANGDISLRVEDQNKNGYDVVIKDVASKAELGDVANRVTNVENKVTQIETDVTTIKTDITTIKTDITNINTRVDNVEALAGKHTTLEKNGTNINVEETVVDGQKNYKVNLNKDITLGDENGNNVSISGTNGTITATGDITTANRINAANGGKLADIDVTGNKLSNGNSSITLDGTNVKVNDKVTVDKDGKISGVAAGAITETSTDAVNGSQLYDTNTHITNVENQVISNSNRINQLGNRVNKVGAGAAALAALHPMDFDPDDKLTFSAGYGNYGGENAAAIGAYYRPDEKVMFSVAGTVGNGENMVNAGVSFALDRTNHVSNSRTALAREVIDLRGQLAVMGAKMAKMEKAFGMLDETKTKLFPDVPANHWAYEYIAKLAGNGYIEGYPDGNFGGDRLMTRYEFAAMLYRAIEKGAALEEKIIKEFEPELGRIRVDRISGEDGDRDKIERVRVNDTKGERDHYGNKLAK